MFYFLKIQTAFLGIIVQVPCVSKLKGLECQGPAATEHHVNIHQNGQGTTKTCKTKSQPARGELVSS